MEMVGFRYDPTDEELMKILMKKVNDAEQNHINHHFDFIVNDCEIYGKIPPWEIYDSHTHYHLHTFRRKLYVFTDLKTTTGNRVCKAAACGTWLEKSKPKRMYDSQGNVIGFDRMLSFKAKDLHSGKFDKTNWIMHEFSLAKQEFGRINTVLSVIYKLNKGSGSDCEEANGRGLKRALSSTTAGEEFSCFNTNAAAVISLEPEPEMPSADDEEFAAWVSGCFSSTATVAEESSTFNATGVMSHGQQDAQAQGHKKRRLDADADADAFTDKEFAAWIADPTFTDEPLSQIFSDLPPLVEVCSQSKSDPVAAVISLEPEPEPEMPSADDEEFAAWVSGCFSSTAAVAEEASTFNATGVMSHGQEDAQAQDHKKRRLDADADADVLTDKEFAAWIADPPFPDEPLSQIFSDLPPLVEGCSQSKSDSVADIDALITSLISDPAQSDEAWSKIFCI